MKKLIVVLALTLIVGVNVVDISKAKVQDVHPTAIKSDPGGGGIGG